MNEGRRAAPAVLLSTFTYRPLQLNGNAFGRRASQMKVRTINDLFPAFASELEGLINSAGRAELADQIRRLPVMDRCRCGESNCAHFYTAPKPAASYGRGHANLMLPSSRGLVVLDLVDEKIVGVEGTGPAGREGSARQVHLRVDRCRTSRCS